MSISTFLDILMQKLRPEHRQPVYLTSLPTPVEESFVLRKEQEDLLYQILKQRGKHILLHGPGGCGKTHMARKLFYRLQQDYGRMAWVEYGTDIRSALTAKPQEGVVENRDVLFDRFISQLEVAPKDTILFIDDVKENAVDDDILAQITGMGITILITSRCAEISPYETHELEPVSLKECVDLFYAHYAQDPERKQQETVLTLAEQLGHNVFAMLLLARVAGMPEKLTYIAKSMECGSLMDQIGQLLQLAGLNKNETFGLQCFALMPSGYAPPDITDWFQFPEGLVDTLVETGWLDHNINTGRYTLHDLVREYFCEHGLPDWIVKTLLATSLSNDFLTIQDNEEDAAYKLAAIRRALERTSSTEPLRIHGLLRISHYYHDKGRYSQALAAAEEALAVATAFEHYDPELLDDVYWELALAYSDSGRYEEALEYYRRSEKYHISQPEPNQLMLARLWNNIGNAFSDLNRPHEALAYLERACPIIEQNPAGTHFDVAAIYHNIASVHLDLGNHPEALKNNLTALNIRLQHLENDHPNIAMSFNNIGNVYLDLGEYDKALDNHLNGLKIRLSALGINHPHTAGSCYNLCNDYSNLDQPNQALDWAVASLQIYRRTVGSAHPDAKDALARLTDLLREVSPGEDPEIWFSHQSSQLPSLPSDKE